MENFVSILSDAIDREEECEEMIIETMQDEEGLNTRLWTMR